VDALSQGQQGKEGWTMKIFLIYALFMTMFIAGFVFTLYFGLPRTENYDALVALSGMIVGGLGAAVVIICSERDTNEKRSS